MPAPTAYTESTLAAYIVDTVLGGSGGVAGTLGLTATSPQVVSAVYAVARLLGVSDVATATDVTLIEAAARWQGWAAAQAVAAGQFSVKLTGGKAFNLDEVFANIQAMLTAARTDWYTAKAAADTAAGITASPGFFFGIACGGRGR